MGWLVKNWELSNPPLSASCMKVLTEQFSSHLYIGYNKYLYIKLNYFTICTVVTYIFVNMYDGLPELGNYILFFATVADIMHFTNCGWFHNWLGFWRIVNLQCTRNRLPPPNPLCELPISGSNPTPPPLSTLQHRNIMYNSINKFGGWSQRPKTKKGFEKRKT